MSSVLVGSGKNDTAVKVRVNIRVVQWVSGCHVYLNFHTVNISGKETSYAVVSL